MYNFCELANTLVSDNESDSAKYYLPSMAIGTFPVRLVMIENKKYKLEEKSQLVEYHEFPNFGSFDSVKTGESAPAYLNLNDENGKRILSVCCIAPLSSLMTGLFSNFKNRLAELLIPIGSGIIKKSTTFSGNTVQEKSTFKSYMDILKGISNDLIAPVFELNIDERYFAKFNDNI